MPITKRIVCLANSRKNRGRCIAGKEYIEGEREWIRPVSLQRRDGSVFENERQYEDGSEPQLGDIIDMELIEPCPEEYQPENWSLSDRRWVTSERLNCEQLNEFLDFPDTLWTNGLHSNIGHNDRIARNAIDRLENSLCLIRVESLTLIVGSYEDNLYVRAKFEYNSTSYNLKVSDPCYKSAYTEEGEYPLGKSLLTISVVGPYGAYFYKLVAAIIECEKMT